MARLNVLAVSHLPNCALSRCTVRCFAGLMLAACCTYALVTSAYGIGQRTYVDTTGHPGDFSIVRGKNVASIYVDSSDYPAVIRAAGDLQQDIARVSGVAPTLVRNPPIRTSRLIIIGTVGKSATIERLVHAGKLDASPIMGKWETFMIQIVESPFPEIAQCLVIAGSDKRGTIYGIYDLSEQIGVSPWYWWADVPVAHKNSLFVKAGKYVDGPPAVKYRGIFLNDEAPSLTGWVKATFGDYNHHFYEEVFELILRLKGNYLWPAMWNNAFNEDDALNPKLADEYGVVMGTSHHEPMLRAQQEWKRHGTGPWDYSTNADVLKAFWAEGIQRNKDYESIITLGMRGDGDKPMSRESNVALLEKIVADQRRIIRERVNSDPSQVPQDWALYKEVQEYYEQGMRVPDDVTLLWCDDNWGNVRRLPTPDERRRSGGAGVYYHFDYVGGPRSYKWLNTVPITKIWEQMTMAYDYGADRIWIVNVGDLKPMEFPIEFFLHLAWAPDRWPKERISEYTRLWAEREFGREHAEDIADIITRYTKYNGRRKPELLDSETYSLVDYREAESVVADFQDLVSRAERIYRKLPVNQRDAFFELLLYPAKACAIVTELYVTAGWNQLYASQGRSSTNDLAARVRSLFQADSDLAWYYNHTLAHGKWVHMMDQTHIGYTSWNEPKRNVMPQVREIEVPVAAQMGVAVESSTSVWPKATDAPWLPPFDVFNRQREYIDVFNHGSTPFPFSAIASAPWILLSAKQGTVNQEQRLWVSVDWRRAPAGRTQGEVRISGAEEEVTVNVTAINPREPSRDSLDGFVEAQGYVSIEAEHFTRKTDAGPVRWERIDDYGRTLSSMKVFPDTADSIRPPQPAACLEYQMYLFSTGTAHVEVITAPTLNFVPGRGLRYGISMDDEPPQIMDILAHTTVKDWEASVKDNVRKTESVHAIAAPGYHILRLCMVDAGVVLQKIVVDMGGLRPSYLGPPESYHAGVPLAAGSTRSRVDERDDSVWEKLPMNSLRRGVTIENQ